LSGGVNLIQAFPECQRDNAVLTTDYESVVLSPKFDLSFAAALGNAKSSACN